MKEKLPAIHIYVGDWLKDEISGCSLASQGLCLRIMFIMHESEKYGYFQQNGKPIPTEMAARRCGCLPEEFMALLKELEESGVFLRTKSGILYSFRMNSDAILREIRRNAGRLGGRPSSQNTLKAHLKQNESKTKAKTNQNTEDENDNESDNESDNFNKDVWFKEIWSKYPKPIGKKNAMRHFNVSVKNEHDLAEIKLALNNYIRYIKDNNIENKYIKHGSTWFNNWKEWVEYKEKGENKNGKRTQAIRAEDGKYTDYKQDDNAGAVGGKEEGAIQEVNLQQFTQSSN